MSGEVQDNIDKDHHKLGRHRAKFSTGSISPSVREWAAMGANEQERRENFKQWAAEEFTKGFASNFRKHDRSVVINPDNVKNYFKFEYNRYYKGRARKNRWQSKSGGAKQPTANIALTQKENNLVKHNI